MLNNVWGLTRGTTVGLKTKSFVRENQRNERPSGQAYPRDALRSECFEDEQSRSALALCLRSLENSWMLRIGSVLEARKPGCSA